MNRLGKYLEKLSVPADFRDKVREEVVLISSIVKWAVLAIMVGMVAGSAAAAFIRVLDIGTAKYHQVFPYHYLTIPAAMFLSALLVKIGSKDAGGHGTEKVIEAVHKHYGKMSLMVAPVKMVATWVTLIGGGSAGKEGPCAQISAGLASTLADVFRLSDEDRKKLVVCGISAGFAAVFGTPLAGALFAMEVLVLGMMFHEVLLPSLIAAVVSCQVTRWWGVQYEFHIIPLKEVFSATRFLWSLGAGLFFGLLGFMLVEFFRLVEYLAHKSGLPVLLRAAVAGVLLVLVAVFVSPEYCGLGESVIWRPMDGGVLDLDAFLWKTLTSAITLGGGGSGGVISPIFFIGSSAGNTFALLFDLEVPVFAAIGLVAMLAGTTNTPVASSFLAIEMFGPDLGPYAAAACVVSYIAIGHRSVYGSQIIGAVKSAALVAPLMRTMDNVESAALRPEARKTLNEIEDLSNHFDPRVWNRLLRRRSFQARRREAGRKKGDDKSNG